MSNYLLIGIGVVVLLYLLMRFIPLGAWIHARLNHVPVSFLSLVFTRWRGIPVVTLIYALIRLKKANIDVPLRELEMLYLEGENLAEYVDKKIADIK